MSVLAALAPDLDVMRNDGFFADNNLTVLHRFMMSEKPSRTLEIGFGEGGSTVTFCGSHRKLGRSGTKQHIAIDPFQRTRSNSTGLSVIKKAGLSDYCRHVEDFSLNALPDILKSGQKFGLIYVDGSHIFEDVFVDFYYCSRLLENGGVIAFDDCADAHVAKVLKFIRANIPALQELDINNGRRNHLIYLTARHLCKVQMTAFRLIGNMERQWTAAYRRF